MNPSSSTFTVTPVMTPTDNTSTVNGALANGEMEHDEMMTTTTTTTTSRSNSTSSTDLVNMLLHQTKLASIQSNDGAAPCDSSSSFNGDKCEENDSEEDDDDDDFHDNDDNDERDAKKSNMLPEYFSYNPNYCDDDDLSTTSTSSVVTMVELKSNNLNGNVASSSSTSKLLSTFSNSVPSVIVKENALEKTPMTTATSVPASLDVSYNNLFYSNGYHLPHTLKPAGNCQQLPPPPPYEACLNVAGCKAVTSQESSKPCLGLLEVSSCTSSSSNSNGTFTEVATAILTNRDNSCPFFERRISLLEPIKVGRAIARVRPAPDNAIFDCKVLSRNHAMLSYEDGRFYLKDTRSSNGTFVNDYRLSPANEISQKHEIFSGDCVKFGVEVTEKKQVYSCIIATIRLFLPDGTEAKPNPLSYDYRLDDSSGCGQNGCGGYYSNAYLNATMNVSPAQLVELSFFIKDALHKQHLLDAQLEASKQLVQEALAAARANYCSMNAEEQMLQRIESLQAKLATYLVACSRAGHQDAKLAVLQEQLLTLIADKDTQDQLAKEAIQAALDAKSATMAQLGTLELEYKAKSVECTNLTLIIADNMKEIGNLVTSCDKARKEMDELVLKLRYAKDEQMKTVSRYEQERADFIEKIEDLERREHESCNRFDHKTNNDATTSSDNHSSDAHLQTELLTPQSNHSSPQQALLRSLQDQLAQKTMELTTAKALQHNVKDSLVYLLAQHDKLRRKVDGKLESFVHHIQAQQHSVDEFRRLCVQLGQAHQQHDDKHNEKDSAMLELQATIHDLELTVENNELFIDGQNEEIEKYKWDIDSLNARLHETLQRERMVKRQQREQLVVQAERSCEDCSSQTDSAANQAEMASTSAQTILVTPAFDVIQDLLAELHQELEHSASQDCFLANDECIFCVPQSAKTSTMEMLADARRLIDSHRKVVDQNRKLLDEVEMLKIQNRSLWNNNQTSFALVMCPLLFIFSMIILAYYPWFSYITGTLGE